MHDSRTLVEHFFRHEYGRLVAVLTRSLGVRNLELVEDVVQSSLSKALLEWGHNSIPDDPGAWLYRTSRNLAIDAIRRAQTERRILSAESSAKQDSSSEKIQDAHFDEEVGDESLRLLFLCCHPCIPLESSIAFALKTVSGFSTDEVSSALLISKANAEKRATRAKDKLREIGMELTELDNAAIASRIDAVQSTIYLLFNEGYSSSSGNATLRKNLCEEAIRLARMLVGSVHISASSSSALLALMLMHVARFDARVDIHGSIVVLKDQDRSQWDWNAIREAMDWMANSAQGSILSRYHVEAAIAWEHCRAHSFEQIDWPRITVHYKILAELQPGPMVRLNLAIALSYASGPEFGLSQLTQITTQDRARLRPWWDCAIADVYCRRCDFKNAINHWQDALCLAINTDQREFIARRIEQATKEVRTT